MKNAIFLIFDVLNMKKAVTLEHHSKGQFFKNMAYFERGMPYLRLCCF